MKNEVKDSNNIINCILLSIEIINYYPLKKFWEHIIIIKTCVFNDNYKKPGNIKNSIKKNKDVINAMLIKDTEASYNIKEFYFNLVDDNGNYKSDENF